MKKTKKVGKSKVGKVTKEKPPEVQITAEAKPEKKEGKALTRIRACVQVLQKGHSNLTKEVLIKEADAIYTKAGGKSNLREAKWAATYVIPCLQAVGMLTEENGVFQLKK